MELSLAEQLGCISIKRNARYEVSRQVYAADDRYYVKVVWNVFDVAGREAPEQSFTVGSCSTMEDALLYIEKLKQQQENA